MAKGDTDEKSKSPKREIRKSESFASYYVNDTQVEVSLWDIRLRLGLISEADPAANRMTVDNLADVRMSPQHAKKLAEILVTSIAKYEQTFGTITVKMIE